MWQLRYWAFPQLAYPATFAPICLFAYVSEAWGGGLGGCGPCRSGRFGSGLSYPFPCSARCSRARRFPRRSSDGADHVWTGSDCYDHSGVPKVWYTGRGRRRQQNYVVVRTRFVVGALRCRVRFSRCRRVRALDSHRLSYASPATSNCGSRRLRSRSPIKQRADCSGP
jgi:hypothetical protein